ncbi:hypothetical protein ACQEVC_23550 [Plantactinospora sp. CA-294935]|uniref:hypothetical protein n=1 Tax=Plantactinospora sp. CA-294935 TaxID=3240012 RepID=UPI003D90DC86
MDPFGIRAIEETNLHVLSARPWAPVVPDKPRSTSSLVSLRAGTASLLRWVADHVEPAPPAAPVAGESQNGVPTSGRVG